MIGNARFWSRVIKTGLWVAAVRIAALWFLFVLHATGRENLDEVLFILLLYPEGLLLRQNYPLTSARGAIGFSGVLLAGSMVIAVVLVALYLVIERAQVSRVRRHSSR